MKKFLNNYMFATANQILSIIVPIVLMPYLSRILQPEGIGRNAFVSSIVSIFVLFSLMSIPIYGMREIAIVKENKGDINRVFSDIYFIQLILSIVTLIFYIIFVLMLVNDSTLFLINFLTVIASIFDISWYFLGVENAKSIAIRNMVIRIISVVCIFLFVNTPFDLPIYVLILSLSAFISQAVMWIPLLREVSLLKPQIEGFKKHAPFIFSLFLPSLAILIYGNLNNILLGTVAGDVELGFYTQAYKIVFTILILMSSLTSIMLPRMAKNYSNGNTKELKRNIKYVLKFVLGVSIPLTFGLILTSGNFVMWFMGEEFIAVVPVIFIIAPKIILVGLTNVLGLQILVAIKEQKKYSISVSVGAMMSIVVNILFVKTFGAKATAFSLLIAEIVIVGMLMVYTKAFYSLREFRNDFVKYVISACIMLVFAGVGTRQFNFSGIMLTAIQFFLGLCGYIIGLIVFKDELLFKIVRIIKNNSDLKKNLR